MATQTIGMTGIKMTKKNRLAILERARALIADKKRWTKGRLRRKTSGVYQYCVLGACEQAAYDLGLAEPGATAFLERDCGGLGYILGLDLSLQAYSRETRDLAAYEVNDAQGHEGALSLLDEYIGEVKKGNAREATS